MVLLFFALDLRSLSPTLLTEVKQEQLEIAYSPWGRGFRLRDFHHAVNCLPFDSYLPPVLDDFGSFIFRDVDFSRIFSDEVLYSADGKQIERKLILISSFLVGNMDSNVRKTLLDAAERCVSVEFVFLEQNSSQLSDISESTTKFRGKICDLENCSFNAYLPDARVFNGLAKRWLRELTDDLEEILQAHFVFPRSISDSINQISCKLCNSINQIMDGFIPHKTCRCEDIPRDDTEVCMLKEFLSSDVRKHDIGPGYTDKNSVKIGEHTLLTEISWRSSTSLCQVSSAVEFNVIERTSLASLSEGVVVGRPYIVIPSVGQETDNVSEESHKCRLNNQIFHGLCRALHSLNQGLVCRSSCNVENMRQTAFYYYYILQPSDNGPMLLRRLAGAEEILPFPYVDLSDSSTAEEIEESIQKCVGEVELRDYNPVMHIGGLHQKFNQHFEEGLQSGLATSECTTAPGTKTKDSPFHDGIEVSLEPSLVKDVLAPQGQSSPTNTPNEDDKGITRLNQEWEQLIVGDILMIDSHSQPSEPNVENSRTCPVASHRTLDTRTSKILERLGNPKQMKTNKATSPIVVDNNHDQGLTTTTHPMKPTFHRLKRKQRS